MSTRRTVPMVERLTVREAGRRLGASPTTIRRMIAAGELLAEREARPQGARWIVLLDAATDAPHHAPERTSATSLEPTALVSELRERVAFLERLTAHQADQISELIRRLPALPAGSSEPPAPAEMPHSGPETAEKPPPARSWWRRLLRL